MTLRPKGSFLRRLVGFARRGAMEDRLDAEMRFHIEMAIERNVRLGMGADEARRNALVAFGGRERFKDDARDEYRSRRLDELGQDVRYALRVLRRTPGFTIAAVLTFALGIGATTAVFSVVNGVLLSPLPYREPGRLAVIWEHDVQRGKDRNVVAVPNFEAWRERSRSFERIAALVPTSFSFAGAGQAERVAGAEVSAGYFGLLGVAPALGREFTREEEQGGGAPVMIVSDGFWQSHLGSDRSVLGRAISIGGRPYTVVGVMPPAFDPPQFGWLGPQSFWLPFASTEQNRSWGRFLLVVGKLTRGVSLDAARTEMRAIGEQLSREEKRNQGWSVAVVGLAEQITGEVRTPLMVLLGAVGLLLLIAVTNVANLTLALTRRREQELAVRRAMGATGGRLVRQLLTQSGILGAIGSVVGLAAAFGAVRILVALLPQDVPRTSSIRVDGAVLLFTMAIAVIATLAFGWIAAARGVPGSPSATLNASGGARVAARLRGGALVTAEIGLGLVLTVLAGLMVRSFTALRAVDLGFDSESVVAARLTLSGDRYSGPGRSQQFFSGLLERMRALPGVVAVSEISTRPFGGDGPATPVVDPSNPFPPGTTAPVADFRFAERDFFRTLRIPMISGTTFDASGRTTGPEQVVISQGTARLLYPTVNPIGRQIRLEGGLSNVTGDIVGVVGDIHLADARTPSRPTIYFSSTRHPSQARDIIVRGAADSDALIALLRTTVASFDPGLPVYRISTMQGLIDASLARDRFTTLLLGAFALISLLLAGVGIYGVFSGDVSQRRKEIGIRVALGASSPGVIALVMRRAVSRAMLGIGLGLVAAVLLARSMTPMLYGVSATDPISFIAVATILLVVALIATLIPALRAARVSPLVAIRTD